MRLGIIWLLTIGLVTAGLASCGGSETSTSSDTTRVITTLPLFADFVREIGGDRVDVSSLVPKGADPHTWEPSPSDVQRVVWTYMTGGLVGILAGALIRMLGTFAIVPLPLLLFAVPAIAAGDVQPAGALSRSAGLAARNFARAWLVWLITVLFSASVVLAMLLIVSAFASNATSMVIGIAMATPIIWPSSALFVRALYGDITGRVVVAPQDRTG